MSDEKITREEDDDQLEASFGLYHLMRNCGLVLRKMGQRFDDDKFDAIDDVLEILPLLLDTLVKVKEAKDGLIEHSILQPFDKVRLLRNKARELDMLSNEDEYWNALPIELREKRLKEFYESILSILRETKTEK
jgi:hypothetical protein